MMSAISAKIHNKNASVIILERNNEIGKKLKLTGGGRCNVTANVSNQIVIESTPKNGKFLFSSLSNFNTLDIQNFFIKEGCQLIVEEHNRVFPKSGKSIDIINTLLEKVKSLDIEILYNTLVNQIDIETKTLMSSSGNIHYDYLIIATGGKTYPHTGSDGIGYEIAKKIGHSITDLIPAEVPLVSNDIFIQNKTLQGLSFKDLRVDILYNNKVKKSIVHDLIFTHFGLSGPAALRASFYVQNILEKEQPVKLHIDFLPSTSFDELLIYKENELFDFFSNRQLPKRLISYIKEISNSTEDIIRNIKKFEINIYTTRGFNQAFVTNGGISLKEIDPKTMKSKLNDYVSFCGEILDMNSYTGGFNITSAFTTGYTAGKFALSNKN